MRPKEIVFLLEEASAKELLEGIFSRIVPASARIFARYVVFDGKQDLEKQLARRIRGYLNPSARFIVLRDQDSAPNWSAPKDRLLDQCQAAGRSAVLVRIAVHELESFYLGDLLAVEKGLGLTGLASRQRSAKFRDPDRLGSPSRELAVLTKGLYQKVSGSRAIAPHLQIESPRSRSLCQLVDAIRRQAAALG